jgi:two-component system nitrogen regulation sensor histidine kinase NtrY
VKRQGKSRRAPRYERRIVAIAVAALLPLMIVAILLAWTSEISVTARWTVMALAVASLFVATYVLHEALVSPLRTLSNLVAAIREEDFSLRARATHRDDALGEVLVEINALSDVMEGRKLEAVEAAALLRRVLYEIDAAILAFDPDNRLTLVNRAGEKLLGMSGERLTGARAEDLGVADLLEGEAQRLIAGRFPGSGARWNVRRTTYRERGLPHRLLIITDISRALREEEVQAWQRIVRVLGHELNNSLAPIKSVASSVDSMVTKETLAADWKSDVTAAMAVIARRVESISRFMRAYSQLARLPEPRKRPLRLDEIARRVASLEGRVEVRFERGAELEVEADEDQIEQLLINIIRNAADAALLTGGAVRVTCERSNDHAVVRIIDDGPGLSPTANLFVPFFTTKPNGTGIGLVLSRQIAEAHGGSLTLENRADTSGCEATLILPL